MAKKPNYSDDDVKTLRAGYDPEASQAERDQQVKDLAAEMGRSVPSIIHKLRSMELYVAKEYKTKKGGKPETKDSIADRIVAAMPNSVEVPTDVQAVKPDAENLARMTKPMLYFLLALVGGEFVGEETGEETAGGEETGEETGEGDPIPA